MRQARSDKQVTAMRRNPSGFRDWRAPLTLTLAGVLVAACGTTVASADLTGFGTAAALLGRQSDANFAEANRIARVAAVDRFVRSPAVGLTEAPFPPAVPAEVANAWRSALSNLERYGLLLGSLTDSSQGPRTTQAFKALGSELNSGTVGADIDPGVAAAFSSLAGVLVDLEAQKRARDILRRTDPEVRALLTAMAAAIGSTDAAGLRGTVAVNWTASTGGIQRAYAAAAEKNNEGEKRTLAFDYLAALDRRQVQLASLASLRSSLLALADAHTAAADGSKRPVGELLTIISDRLDEVDRLAAEIEKEGRKRD
ncbi:hypothetical protein [Sphingomonas sp. PB4P5]|uniref:hypothetical protein n=1 Tax=Parasphingomonas puruogangriensis TaxID=3096155 RepID=UPI002FC5AE58